MNYSENVTYRSLKDKVVAITGGASGIGEELVRAYVAQGARVAFLDFNQAEGEKLATELGCLFLFCDVTNIPQLKACFETIADRLGDVDILINNAGSDDHHTIDNLTEEYFNNRINVNLRHHLFAIQAVIPGMEKKGAGSIINMGSINWMRGRPAASAIRCRRRPFTALPARWRRSWGRAAFALTAWCPARSKRPSRKPCGPSSIRRRLISLWSFRR
ncbi:3-beta-hydroxysteroid dehydrogenase [Leminorella grimontii]|nr:3-beta-hydroxysteroid dehydrogenase [Leminorella grimontii]